MWLRTILTFVYALTLVLRSAGDEEKKRRVKRLMTYGETCQPGCMSCSAVNGCVMCDEDMFLFLHRDGIRQTGVCLRACPQGYFALVLPTAKRCFKCMIENCDSCYSNSFCKKCSPPYTLHHGRCVMKCPSGLYYDSQIHACSSKVECAVGEWGSWTECSRNSQTCGFKYGIQSRSRHARHTPSPSPGLACPNLNEYRECRMAHRYCSDLENNHSQLVAQRKPVRKQQIRRLRRRRCRQRGRLWKRGKCLKMGKRQQKKPYIDLHGNTLDYSNKFPTRSYSK